MSRISSTVGSVEADHQYYDLERLIARRVAELTGPLFTTDASINASIIKQLKDDGGFVYVGPNDEGGLFDAYLAGIPTQHRQHYNCNCCRRFVNKYGGLVQIETDPTKVQLRLVLWAAGDDGGRQPVYFIEALSNLYELVCKAKITGVFLNADSQWGTPSNVAGPGSKHVGTKWTHLHGEPTVVFKHALLTADQMMAEKRQDYITLKRGLSEVPMEAVVQAVRVLESDAVDRGEKTLGCAKWLLDLHQQIAEHSGRQRDNLIWLAVATAPPGFCHVRSTMIATLLDDVVAGLEFAEIKRRWDAKMHPLRYQRPTTVSDGAIKQANEVVEKLGSQGSLTRRYAKVEEVVALWRPREAVKTEVITKPGSGPFDRLLSGKKAIKPVELPPKRTAFHEFLPALLMSEQCEVYLTHGHMGFFGMTTAVDPDAPPILQWDGVDGTPRNPVCWYYWDGGSRPEDWNLPSMAWAKAAAVCMLPCHWHRPDKFAHFASEPMFILQDAVESRKTAQGFFPECLRTEYRAIAKPMEALAKSTEVQGREQGTANGVSLSNTKGKEGLTVRLTTGGDIQTYVVVK